MNTKMILIALLSLSPATQAAPALDCPSLESLEALAEDCGGNLHFARAAQKCSRSLETALLKTQLDITAGLQVPGDAPAKAFENALSNALALAERAREQVAGYRASIYFPEDFDAPEEVIGNAFEFLDANACYAENERYLDGLSSQISAQASLLQKAKTGDMAALREFAAPGAAALHAR